MNCKKEDLLLYAVTDRSWLKGETLSEQVEKALQGGATFIQFREKHLDGESLKEEALRVQAVCKKYHVPFVINDNVELAKEIDADGVHVGQKDLKAQVARELLGPDKIIGVTAPSVELAVEAQKAGADYIGAGAVFPTSSKDDAKPLSHESLRAICESVTIPVVAIGGVSKENVVQLTGSKIAGIAVISAIFAQEDIVSATKELRMQTKAMLEE